jgi:putative MFS transporter
LGHALPAPKAPILKHVSKQSFAEILRPSVPQAHDHADGLQFLPGDSIVRLSKRLPALVNAQNHNAPRGPQVSFLITLAYPRGPLLSSTIAEKYERKWQIVGAAVGTAVFGMLFATHTTSLGLVVLGIRIILMNSLLAFCSHTYQSELFPTRMRARAIGFVYSWGRLSIAFTSLIIGFLFQRFGTRGVFVFISLAILWSSSLSEFSGRAPAA